MIPLGRLVILSGYFPKWVGYCLYIGALGYLLGFVVQILFPDMKPIYSISEILTLGEVVFILYFVIMGIRRKAIE